MANKTFIYIILAVVALVIAFMIFQYFGVFSENFGASKEIIYFSRSDCGACKSFQSTWNLFASNLSQTDCISIKQIDINSNPDAATEFNINGVPTVLAVKNGKPIGVFRGERTYENLIRFYTQFQANG